MRRAESESGRAAVERRIERCEQERATLDEVRRVELDFPVDVAPVGGQRRERPIPLVLQRFASLQLRGVHFLRSEHFEVADDSLLVEAVQQTAKRVRCQSTTASGG